MGSKLVAVEINHEQLCCIKDLFSRLAIEYSYWNLEGSVDFQKLFDLGNTSNPWYKRLSELNGKIAELIVCSTVQGNGQGLINVACQRTSDLEKIKLYSLLSFAKDNYWTHLISEKSLRGIELSSNSSPLLHPIILSGSELRRYTSLVNPGFLVEHTREAVAALVKLKSWQISD